MRLAQAVAGGRRVDGEIRAHAATDQPLVDEVADQLEVLGVAQLAGQHGQISRPTRLLIRVSAASAAFHRVSRS